MKTIPVCRDNVIVSFIRRQFRMVNMKMQILAIICTTLLILLEIHSVIACARSETHKKYVIGHIVTIVLCVIVIVTQILLLGWHSH